MNQFAESACFWQDQMRFCFKHDIGRGVFRSMESYPYKIVGDIPAGRI